MGKYPRVRINNQKSSVCPYLISAPVQPTPAHAPDLTFREAFFAPWTRLGSSALCSNKTATLCHWNQQSAPFKMYDI